MKLKNKLIGMFLVLATIFLIYSCKEDPRLKGIELEVSFSDTPLTDRLFTDVEYLWRTRKDFKGMDQDRAVFVHFWHGSNLIVYDNHRPEIPTSQWAPGKEYLYSRRIYIPQFMDEIDPEFKGTESLKLSIGFSFPEDKTGHPLKKIYERRLKVFPPPPDTPKIVYDEGWYGFEIDADTPLKRWRWTAQEARCVIDNPHRDALLVIKGGVRKDILDRQKVVFRLNGMTLDEFIPEKSHFEKSYRIGKEKIGEKDKFFLIITTDQTYIPARVFAGSEDDRELGVQVAFIYFR
jgi:hypothetical protein